MNYYCALFPSKKSALNICCLEEFSTRNNLQKIFKIKIHQVIEIFGVVLQCILIYNKAQ